MDRYAVSMIDWRSHLWKFTGDWSAGITSGGIDGLIGSMSDIVARPLGVPGQMVLEQHAEPMTGSINFHCRAGEDKSVDQVVADFRAAWSNSINRRNRIVVASPLGNLTTTVRLNGALPAPVEDPSWSDMVKNLSVPVIADEGLWWLPMAVMRGDCDVVNYGDVPVWFRIRWSGAGGRVVLDSGATFNLPAVKDERVVLLSRHESLAVLDKHGNMDVDLWRTMRGVYPTVVLPGRTARVKLPEGAQLEYQIGVMDPWR